MNTNLLNKPSLDKNFELLILELKYTDYSINLAIDLEKLDYNSVLGRLIYSFADRIAFSLEVYTVNAYYYSQQLFAFKALSYTYEVNSKIKVLRKKQNLKHPHNDQLIAELIAKSKTVTAWYPTVKFKATDVNEMKSRLCSFKKLLSRLKSF